MLFLAYSDPPWSTNDTIFDCHLQGVIYIYSCVHILYDICSCSQNIINVKDKLHLSCLIYTCNFCIPHTTLWLVYKNLLVWSSKWVSHDLYTQTFTCVYNDFSDLYACMWWCSQKQLNVFWLIYTQFSLTPNLDYFTPNFNLFKSANQTPKLCGKQHFYFYFQNPSENSDMYIHVNVHINMINKSIVSDFV